jgi:hypothetical protein
MAGWTGIEPATSGLTGQRSNQAELPPRRRHLKINSYQRKTNKTHNLFESKNKNGKQKKMNLQPKPSLISAYRSKKITIFWNLLANSISHLQFRDEGYFIVEQRLDDYCEISS